MPVEAFFRKVISLGPVNHPPIIIRKGRRAAIIATFNLGEQEHSQAQNAMHDLSREAQEKHGVRVKLFIARGAPEVSEKKRLVLGEPTAAEFKTPKGRGRSPLQLAENETAIAVSVPASKEELLEKAAGFLLAESFVAASTKLRPPTAFLRKLFDFTLREVKHEDLFGEEE